MENKTKKYEIGIREKLTYVKRAIIEVPADTTDVEFEKYLDILERKVDTSGDLPYVRTGMEDSFKVMLVNPNDWSSPEYSEMEIEEYDLIKEEE